MTNQGMFVLGVGAQKAGTSWMRWYMQQAPNVDCGPCKEYHVWDALTLPDFPRTQVSPAQAQRNEAAALRFRMQQDPEVYFSYFEECLAQPGITVTADITPLYAALSVETLRRIRDGFAARGVACRVVFLMRDPLHRCWSQARMNHRRRNADIDFSANPSAEELLAAGYQDRRMWARTEYHKTFAALDAAFDPANIHYGFYETMFSLQEVARMSDFFGVASRPELIQQRVNANPAPPPLPDSLARTVAQEYRAVYENCAARWPELREVWPGFAYL